MTPRDPYRDPVSEARRRRGAADRAARDAQYRESLGVKPGEPLPKKIGNVGSHVRRFPRA